MSGLNCLTNLPKALIGCLTEVEVSQNCVNTALTSTLSEFKYVSNFKSTPFPHSTSKNMP